MLKISAPFIPPSSFSQPFTSPLAIRGHAPRILGWCGLAALIFSWFAPDAEAHGTLVGGRMFEVRQKGPGGNTPAGWNESYYTWNQNSNNFPDYDEPGFSYANFVPSGKIGSAGINDGVGSALNFSGLNTPSALWQATPATAGGTLALHFVATAPHDPSFFQVYFTKPEFDPTTATLGWSNLTDLGRWSIGNSARPVTIGTAPSPSGGTLMSYDWTIPIPGTASGRETVVVIWQREDPAGEAFFAIQDLQVAGVPEPASAALLLLGVAGMLGRRQRPVAVTPAP